MTAESEIRRSFGGQAKSCDSLGSPFTARLCRLAASHLDRSTAVGEHILNWPGEPSANGDALALRLAGALHALVLAGHDERLAAVYPPHESSDEDLWAAVSSAFESHEALILERLSSAPQTNEVRRSGILLPGFLTLSQLLGKPLVLSEIGSSAGLNLQWDRYGYDLGGLAWGDASSGVLIAPQWEGAPPPAADIRIEERRGCDLNPLDASSPADRLRLLSYIWADQTDRIERTRAALSLAAANPPPVTRADAVGWLAARLESSYPGAIHVIYHSIVWQYLPVDARAEGERLISEAGARATSEAPLAHLQMEADDRRDGASVTLQVWPGGESRELGRADFHGRWIKWAGWASG
ncbi:DUF2332 family protein [Rhizobium sp. BK251]|uniref:DUF2332 domain-containing protein n=1 Tax=Rhizobium sp. BK251 TaxID=2512125 RepID=UPI00105250B4|nr:DUF2332 family protein [Rhizobium sp. BK251]TCL69645.1 hypothetical protein EV286_108218 [Rhizobium sp. BK251]